MILQVIGFLLILIAQASKVETTEFFEQQLGHKLQYKAYSGYQDVDWYYQKGTAGVYYSFWQKPGSSLSSSQIPLIIWLEGGPGVASQFSCFNELGPIFIQGRKGENQSAIENPYGWNRLGHLMCVDQPIGVGFSYNKNEMVIDSYTAGHHFLNFLFNFLNEWNLHKNPVYLAGESYAGHYIPVFARMLMLNRSMEINLQGIIIGGSYTDPTIQVNHYQSSLYSLGLASQAARTTILHMQNQALTNIFNQKYQTAADYINWIIATRQSQVKFFCGVDLENYRLHEDSDVNDDYWYFLVKYQDKFGVPPDVKYIDPNLEMYEAFGVDLAKSMTDELEYLLDRHLKVMIYNGQNDVIVNTPGVLTFLNTLNWHGLKNWQKTPKQQWFVGTTNSGWFKKYDNFRFLLVRNAGHLVAADQPRLALQMMVDFFSDAI